MFRWPTPITDSDDDLKSELTDLTYTCVRNKKTIPATESCNLNDYTKTENLNNTPEKKEKHNYSTNKYNSQNYEKNASFVKPFISNSEKDVILIEQTKNIKSLRDEDNKQNFKSEKNPLCSSRKANKLKDILQEDKLNIIINNLADRNCSPKYIDKIIEMFECLDYVVSYRTESECNNDSIVFASRETSKSETIPMQQNLICDDNCTNTNKPEDKITKLKSYGHSTDLGYGSIKNDSNAIQLSNPVNIKPKDDKDSDKSESETYAGVPKISIERVLKSRETSRRMYKRKVRKKMVYPNAEKHATDLTYDAEEVKFESVHVANPITMKKNLPPDESCVSITEDEVEMSNKKECRQTINVTQRPQKMTFSSHREIQRNNFDLYGRSKSLTHVQNEQPFDASEAQRVNLNVFIKEKKIPYRVQEKAHSQFVADVDYTINSDIDVVTISTNTRKSDRTDGNMITSHANANQDIVISSENNSDFPEKPRASPKLRREFIEQTKSEIATKKAKPTIISSMPVNLNLRISRADPKARQLHDSNVIVKNEDEQDANIQPLEEIDKKKTMLKTSIAKKSAINDSHSKTTVDNKREVCPTTNNKNESANINSTNPTNSTIEQPKSNKLGVEKNPKVLTAWIPKVVYYAKSKSELGLTFQGKLLK